MPDESLSNPDHSCAARFLSSLIPHTDNPEDAEFLRGLLLLGGALFTLALLAYACTINWTWPFPRDKVTLVLGRDFLNLWMYGRAVADTDPARFYDLVTYNAELAKLLGPGYPGQNWPNPPTALVVMAPFGLLAYFPALIAWFGVGSRVLPRGAPRDCRRAYSRGGPGLAGRTALRALGPEFVAHDRSSARDLLFAR